MAFMRDAKNLNWAFVSTYQGTASTGTVTAYSDLNDGEVVVLTKSNAITASALSSGDQFKIAQRSGTELIVSPLFTFSSATAANYAAPAQQVTTIGSNGTTAVLLDPAITDTTTAAAAVGNSYYVLIEKNDNDEATRTGYRADITAQVKLTNPNAFTAAPLVQVRLAELLRESLRKNDQFEACGSAGAARYLSVKARIVASGAAALFSSGSGQTLTCTFGSKTATLSTVTAITAEVAEGNYLLIGSDTYRIADVTGTTVTFDFPFAGTTGAFTSNATPGAATVSVFLDSEMDDATGVGLEITGTDQHDFDVDRHRMYSQSRFNVRFAKDGEGVGTVAVATKASEGVNDWRIVSTDIYTSMGNFGQRWNGDVPAALRDTASTVDSTKGYAIIDVAVSSDRKELMYSGTATQKVRIYLEEEDGPASGIASDAAQALRLIDVFLPSGQSDITEN